MKIYINTDTYKQIALDTEKELVELADELNIEVADDIARADIVFSIGGDGTFLKTSKLTDRPLIGVNTGTLGYLTEVNPGDLSKALEDIMNGEYHIEDRMMLEGEIIKPDGEVVEIPDALNEIAISKNTFGVVRFDVLVNDRLINSYTADGILVCTPTGSTAYNLSCGGPIADPTAEILTMTPIAPHTVINRSIVLSKDSTVVIRITELRDETQAYVLYDGRPIQVFSNDTIRIFKSSKVTRIIKLEDRSFIDTVRESIS